MATTANKSKGDDPVGAIRAAQDKANAEAQAAKERTTAVPAGSPLARAADQPSGKVNHTTMERPADAGFVYASPAQAAEAQGKWAGGTPVTGPAPRVDVNVRAEAAEVNEPPDLTQETGTISAEGVPDIPALERHNKDVADSMEATFLQTPSATTVPQITSPVAGNLDNTIEGQLANAGEAEGVRNTSEKKDKE